MFIEVFRNMWRRKLRSTLTIAGIVIGIFAFTVMGSMAVKFNAMIGGAKRYVTGQISVMPKGTVGYSTGGGSTLPVDTLNKIAEVDGVEAVGAGVELLADEPTGDVSVSFGAPKTIEGMDLSSNYRNRNWETMDMKSGKMVTSDDSEDSVTIGYDIAQTDSLEVGDTITVRGRDFAVVGILSQTLTGPDKYIFMSINPAREILVESSPFLKSLKEQADQAEQITSAELARLPKATREQLAQASTFRVEDLSTAAGVSWKDGEDPEVVAERIKDQLGDEVLVYSPKQLGDVIDKASAAFNSIILGSALIALIVGGFSIVNTMIMSISERTREIGIKKALGASQGAIAREYTLESAIIGLIGGLIGTGLGTLFANLLNQQLAKSGSEIFLVKPWFLATVIGFSLFLGVVAGMIPAARAARLKVVKALREL